MSFPKLVILLGSLFLSRKLVVKLENYLTKKENV